MREISVQNAKDATDTWTLHASETGLTLERGAERYVVPAEELGKRAALSDGVVLRGLLAVSLGEGRKRDAFRIDDAATTELLRALGPDVAVRWLLGQRVRFFVVIAMIFLLSSLPIPGDPDAGIEAIPADLMGGLLGLGLLVLAGAARYRPQAWLFVFDAGWLVLLATTGAVQVINGSGSPWWLALDAWLVVSALTAIRVYRRLRAAGARE